MLYKSEFIQSILLSSAVEGFTFFRLPPREAVWKVSNVLFCTAVDIPHFGASHMKLLNTHVHLGVYPFLLGMSVTSLCSPLGLNPAWQWSLNIALILLRTSPVDWTNSWPKTTTFEILINDRFPPDFNIPYHANLNQVNRSETWVWWDQSSNLRLKWVCVFLNTIVLMYYSSWMNHVIIYMLK